LFYTNILRSKLAAARNGIVIKSSQRIFLLAFEIAMRKLSLPGLKGNFQDGTAAPGQEETSSPPLLLHSAWP
jgi:hypothetical protein